jgi:hypothetical protein
MEERNRGIEEMKSLRATHGVSISEAEKMALADPAWRRWVERKINTDTRCRSAALSYSA